MKALLWFLHLSKTITPKIRGIDRNLLFGAVLSFLLGRTVLAGSLAPFGVGVYSGLRVVNPNAASVLFGICSLLGSVSLRRWELVGYHALAMLLVTLMVRPDRKTHKYPVILDYLLTGSMIALSRATVTALVSPSLYGYISAVIEGMCGIVIALMAAAAFEPPDTLRRDGRKTEARIVLSVISLGGLHGIGFPGVSIESVLVMAVTLCAGFLGGPPVGAVTGLSGGLILALTANDDPLVVGTLGIAGMLAGVGGWFGRIESVLGYLSSGLLMSLFASSGSAIGYRMVEQVLSSIPVFLLTPRAVKNLAEKYPSFVLKRPERHDKQAVDPLRLRAAAVAHALKEVGSLLDQVSASSPGAPAEAIDSEDETSYASQSPVSVREVAERICHDCPKRETCWEENFAETFAAMSEVTRKAHVAGVTLSRDDETGIAVWCQRFGEILREVNHLKEMRRLERRLLAIDGETKECLAYQYKCLGKMLAEPKSLENAQENARGPKFRITLCGKSLPAEGDAKTGDTWIRYDLGPRKTLVVLVDGMGKGQSAAKQSRDTVDLMKALLGCGLDFESCVSFLNSALFLAWRPDSFVAVDCLLIDQDAERAYFHKLGAPPSFIKKADGNVLVVRGARPPAGAFKTIPALATAEPISPDDTIYLVSDGVFRSSPVPARAEHLIVARLRRLKDVTLEASVRALTGQGQRYKGQPADDVTVVGIRIDNI